MPVVFEVILLLALLSLLLLVMLLIRQRTISQRVGSVHSQLRYGPGREFVPGSVQYTAGEIDFYRTFSLKPTPTVSWQRAGLEIIDRGRAVELGRTDVPAHFAGQYLVVCRYYGQPVELLMTQEAYAGLASWLEAAPPGGGDLVY